MKPLPPNRRAAAIIASLGAVIASSAPLLARHGEGFTGSYFLGGLLVGAAVGLALLLLIKWRRGSSGADPG